MKALPAPKPSAEEAKRPSVLMNMLALLIVTLIAAGTGAGLGFTIADVKPVRPKDEAAAAARAAETGSVVRLSPIVTNLARPKETWIRLEGSLVVDGVPADKAGGLAAEVGADLMAYLRTLALPQIEGAAGLQALREDLTERVRLRSNGRARELLIETLVVQ